MGVLQQKEILKLDESCISDPKSEISNWTGNQLGTPPAVQSEISDFGSEMQDSSNFKISFFLALAGAFLSLPGFDVVVDPGQ